MKFFLTASANHLKRRVWGYGCEVANYESYTFADGEHRYRLKERVKGERVVIISSILPAPESLFEVLSLHRLAFENGASEIRVVIPYLGYARQDRPTRPGEGSLGVMVLEWLQKMNPAQLILFDIHSDLLRKAFRPFVTEVSALPLIAHVFEKSPPDVIVSPDTGFLSRAEKLRNLLKPEPGIAVIEKVRPKPNRAIAKHLHGDVGGKDALIVDDMIDTGGTLSEAVKIVLKKGATRIRVAATHGIFSKGAKDRLLRLPIEEIFVTNTLPQTRDNKIRVLDITSLIIKALT
jgi:ribose-phosphate pyrophosphokinase